MGRTTKARAPHPIALLPRADLVETLLATPAGGACVLVSGPGYGRRTLLDLALGAKAAVVTLPPEPIDAAAWRSLLAAALGDDQPETAVKALRRADRSWLVVLDLDPLLHEAALADLADLAAERPAGVRIAITSGSDLGATLGRRLGADRLVELDGDDLALSPEESRQLLRERLPDIDDAVAEQVVELCDGWVAALVSATRHQPTHSGTDLLTWLRTRGAARAFGAWLEGVAPETRDMLLDTAILDQLHPSLVDVICGGAVGSTLAPLASAHGPLRLARVPTTPDGPWFERHPLLTSLLRYLAAGRPAETERHRRAADWFLERGVVREELTHRLLAGDATAAVDRLHHHENELLATGLAHMALRWYQALPANGLAAEDLLRETWAFALSDRIVEARRSLDRLRLSLRSEAPPSSSIHPRLQDLDAEADVLEAWLSEHGGDLVRTLSCSAHARTGFGESWATNSHQLAPLLHARAALHLGDTEAAQRILVAVRDEPFLSAALGEGRRTATESELAWARGELVRARSWAARHDRWRRDQDGARLPKQASGGSIAGFQCLAESGELLPAVTGLRAIVEHARATSGNVTEEVLARVALAATLGTHRGPRAGMEQLAVARDVVLERCPDGGLLQPIAMLEARLRLAGGDPLRAERLLRGLPPSTTRQLLLARAALQRKLPSATASVRDLVPANPREEATHALLLAWATLTISRQRAEQHLLRAADVCAENGMTTLLADVPEPLLDLARSTASYHVHDPLTLLVTTVERLPARGGGSTEVEPPPAVHSALTRGELQLLALLPTRASNARIAEHLGVSVNTVKTRLRRLYAKLDAHDRDDAVARARAAGVLPSPATDLH